MSDLTNAVQQILDTQQHYTQAENYYNGTVPEFFASRSVAKELEKLGDPNRVNFAATPVNAVANRLEVTGISTMSEPARIVVDQVWQQNNLELELTQLINRTLVFGSAYLICWPDSDGTTQIYYNSPLSMVMLYEPENPRQPRVAAKLWSVTVDGKPRTRVNLYYSDRIEKNLSTSERLPMTVKDTDFEPFIDEQTDENGSVANPFGQIPVFHFTTGVDQYGRPEHINAYGPQDMITKMLVSQMASVEHYGFPTRWMLRDANSGSNPLSDVEDDADDVLDSAPGQVWDLDGVAKVGQFEAAKPDTYIAPYREYVRAMASVTDTPLHYFENTHTNVSGESLRAAEAPLVKKVRTRQLAIGHTLRQMFVFVLKMNNIAEDVQIQWRQIESIDTKEQWEIAYKKLQAGLPVEQILLEQGYDTELVAQWKKDGLLQTEPSTTEVPNTTIEGEAA
jgi:hypothetical protein